MSTRFVSRWAAVVMAAAMLALVPAAAQAAIFSFSVQPPNTAENPDTGDVIRVAAHGVFDTESGDILSMGTYTIVSAGGAVVERGRFEATDFVSFSQAEGGGPSPGFQTGVLDMDVTLFPDGGDPRNDDMRIVCNIPGFQTGLDGGTTVGDFTEVGGEFTLFNLHVGRR